ncbi:hypothetical protein PU630_01315 [Microbacterium horticulturae]|uniref:Uncharacterized protein n=1 Tax=Microbacterium horticulturae TaxID=3028316 RepID=A0ABY8BYJ0_9MICO|nr:hypothetical protein [Microbacterium sp. KACC 23027]WEG09229.1 hypothetical protein PU630_01315 [Microbacterium sp. KACC 23027]
MGSFSWVHLLVLLAVVAIIVLVVALALRGWRRRGIDTTVGITLSGAAIVAAVSLLLAIGTVITVLASDSVHFTIPVNEYWPPLPDGVTVTTSAHLESGGFTSADVWVTGASTAARVFWALGQGIGYLVPAAVAALIAITCFQLLRGVPFARMVVRAALVTAVMVLVGGVTADVLSQIGGSIVSHELLSMTAASWTDPQQDIDALLPQPTMSVMIPFWPIGAGLGFAALAAVLKYGAVLQRDTERLV